MGLFDKLFKKKKETATEVGLTTGDIIIATGDRTAYKMVHELTDKQVALVRESTLLLMTNTLYMHYWTEHLECTDPNDPEWQNKVLFFWKADEDFPKKSLPPQFNTFQVKQFIFVGDVSRLKLQIGEAMPWFGMPGLGQKHQCLIDNQPVTIPELAQIGLVQYMESIALTEDNLDILTDRENYFFIIDNLLTPYYDGDFHLDGNAVPIDVAYQVGGIRIVKNVKLEE